MACPRCEIPLTTYSLSGRDTIAVVCGECGFADVPAADSDDETDRESWDDALDRFSDAVAPMIEAEPTDRTQSVTVPEADTMDEKSIQKAFEATRVSIESPADESESE
jgi:hypothetical protein